MSVPLHLALIVVVWAVAIVGMKRDYDHWRVRRWGAFVLFFCAIIVTLAILLARAWWGWP